jgi:cellulose synthase/poly-beta-1,6-N-acetylglucosamine synthase-like glycosyltransferase
MIIEEWIVPLLGMSFMFYGSVTILLLVGLRRIKSRDSGTTPFVSVVVAARNEENNLPRLLDSLLAQSYRFHEVIIVDDESSDRTLAIAREYASDHPHVRVVSSDTSSGTKARKKAALATGIRSSKGDILCFTDADCLPGSEWISMLVKQFTDEVGIVAGYSPYDAALLPEEIRPEEFVASVFHRFLRYEEMKGAIWSAGSIGLGKAWLCTGRNLAYRRKVWDEVSGFSNIMASISGDDDLFLQLVQRSTRWKISYVLNPRSFVPTAPPGSFHQFVRQRKRHFSAGKFFTFPMKVFFLLFHGSNLFLFLAVILGMFIPGLLAPALILYFAKATLDLWLVTTGATLLSERNIWQRVVPMEFLCLSYNTLIGPLGFVGTFEWKTNLKS